MSQKNNYRINESGVSELIGAIVLIAMIVLVVVVFASFLTNRPAPNEIPEVRFSVVNVSQHDPMGVYSVNLTHTGGDTLNPGEYSFFINDNSAPVVPDNIKPDPQTTKWSVGTTIMINSSVIPDYIRVYYYNTTKLNNPALLGQRTIETIPTTTLVTTIPTNTPITTDTTTIPTTTVTTTIPTTTVTTTVPTTIPTTPVPSCGTISGIKWNDLNGNGEKDPGEPTMPNWEMKCYYRQSGNNWILVGTTTTDSNGDYIFTGLQYSQSAEQYYIKETAQSGWIPTNTPSGQSQTNVLNPSHCYATNVDFGNRFQPPFANQLYLNAPSKPGTLVGGRYMQFRYTGPSNQ